jgi:hypothetical protein
LFFYRFKSYETLLASGIPLIRSSSIVIIASHPISLPQWRRGEREGNNQGT